MASKVSNRAAFLQSTEEWDARNRALVDTLVELMHAYMPPGAARGLDVGCQTGDVTEAFLRRIRLEWHGVDPTIADTYVTASGCRLVRGWAHELPYPEGHFDVVILSNVYEHLDPSLRVASLAEIGRVLVEGGCVVGQIPNPYFPIEAHSRLPFMGWLPVSWQRRYWRLSPVAWEHDFQVVTTRHLRRDARQAGLETASVRNFNYPPEALPRALRGIARVLERPMRVVPWAWQFALRKPAGTHA
jgi:SAM-dependent methyltransferase